MPRIGILFLPSNLTRTGVVFLLRRILFLPRSILFLPRRICFLPKRICAHYHERGWCAFEHPLAQMKPDLTLCVSYVLWSQEEEQQLPCDAMAAADSSAELQLLIFTNGRSDRETVANLYARACQLHGVGSWPQFLGAHNVRRTFFASVRNLVCRLVLTGVAGVKEADHSVRSSTIALSGNCKHEQQNKQHKQTQQIAWSFSMTRQHTMSLSIDCDN